MNIYNEIIFGGIVMCNVNKLGFSDNTLIGKIELFFARRKWAKERVRKGHCSADIYDIIVGFVMCCQI